MSFDQFEVHPRCLTVLTKQGITTPTPVQEQTIPVALEGHDVIGIAQTGTGKTLAFALPALSRLAQQPAKGRGIRMLVLTPTRELAQQVHNVIEPLAKMLDLQTATIYGGVGMEPQTKALRRGCPIIIATPGRLIDHMDRGAAKFNGLTILVLDEADRMLDMGFMPAIKRIVGAVPTDRQTLLFSATFPEEIAKLAKDFQRQPKRIEVGPIAKPIEAVRQGVYTVHPDGKMNLLSDILRKPGVDSAIVFIRTKHRTERVAKALAGKGFKAQAIHGGRSQSQRQKALDGFRRGQVKILVATDVAARGIDVKGVTHVVNFDIPQTFDDYVHRIGRTARANATGDAITLVCPQDHEELGSIERGLGRTLPQETWDGAVAVRSLFKVTTQRSSGTAGAGKSQPSRRRRFTRSRQRSA